MVPTTKGNGISAELDITFTSDVSIKGTSQEMPIITNNGNSPSDANGETDSQVPTIKTYPHVYFYIENDPNGTPRHILIIFVFNSIAGQQKNGIRK